MDRTRSRRTIQRCIFETLEQRQLLALMPAPFPGYVGPLAEMTAPHATAVSPGSAPTATLLASALTQPQSTSYVFKVVYRDDVAVRVSSIDNYDIYVHGPNGYVRRAVLIGVDEPTDGPVRIARYKVGAPDGGWNRGHNGHYQVIVQPNQVFDIYNAPVRSGVVGEFTVRIGRGVGSPNPSNLGVDIRRFGAVPNDGIDDSVAIQAAIDSLPFGDGSPTGSGVSGGIVYFPPGVFDITRPIMLRNAVMLRGAGSGLTTIHDIGTDRNRPAIMLHSPYSHRWHIGSSVQNLHIYSRWGGGIWVDPNMGGDVQDIYLANLRMSTLGPAIDLSSQATYHSQFENIEIYNPGSTAWHSGKYDGLGANMVMRNIRVSGVARSGFVADKGMVMIISDHLVQGLVLSYTGANVVPLYFSGKDLSISSVGSTLYDVDIQVPRANCLNGIAVHADGISRVDFDYLKGIGLGKRIRLTNAHDVQVQYLQSDGSTNVLSSLFVKDIASYFRAGNVSNGVLVYPPKTSSTAPFVLLAPPTNVVDATAFGAIPDDDIDDTAAIQAAINSLPKGNGIPSSSQQIGGIVQLPLGILTTTAPLKLHSGVWLRGHNSGTVIRNLTLNDPNRAIIELTSPFTHRSNIGAGLIELGIFASGQASGVKTDSTITGELKYFRMSDVRVRVGGPGIDLRNARVNYAHIERIKVPHPGALAIWVGRPDNSSIGNRIRGVRIFATRRSNFIYDKAMFVFHGDTTIEGGSIEEGFQWEETTNMRAFYASGKLTMNEFYHEYAKHSSNVSFLLDNVRGNIDRLTHINTWRRVGVINSSDVTFRSYDINGYPAFLKDTIFMDGTSRFTMNTVNARYDSGLMDHPRVNVKGYYNETGGFFVETAVANSGGTDLVADPGMTRISETEFNPSDWTIVWSNSHSGPQGTWSLETVGGVKRLKIVIPSPTWFDVRVKLNVPASAVGKKALVRYRVDGPATAPIVIAWNFEEREQILSRVMGSMTAGINHMPLRANEQIWFNFGSVTNLLPAGTYYLSKVRAIVAP